MKKQALKIKELHVLLFPPCFWLILFLVFPLIIVLFYSVSYKGLYGGIKPGFILENYKDVFTATYLNIFLRSFIYAAVTTIITVLLAYPTAYFMAFASPKVRFMIMFIIIIPFWTNFLIRMYSFVIILGNSGVINTILIKCKIISEPLTMLNNSFSVILGLVYCNLPFMILPIYASLDKMDSSLLEASSDLGAGKLYTFLRITFPYSISGLVAGIVFVFIPTLGNFVVPDILGGANDVMIGNVITSQFRQARNWPLGSAMSTILIFVVMIFISLYIRYFDPTKQKKAAF